MTADHPKILCLVNAAAYSRTYFEELRPYLAGRGIDMAFALDSHLPDVVYGDGQPIPGAWYFTDFCAKHPPLSPSELERRDLRWDGLFSDFDRFLTLEMRVPLAQGGKLAYQHIPLLLERFFTQIFDEVRPVAVLYEQASNSFALAANMVARKRGIPFFSLAPGRIGGRVEISPTGALRDHITVGRILERVKQEGASQEARDLADHYISTVEHQVPDYMRKGGDGEVLARTGLFAKYFNRDKLRHLLRGWRHRRTHRADASRAYMVGDAFSISFILFRRSVKRWLRVRRVLRYYRHEAGPGAYFLYPLHFHPEASTSVLAPDFIDEMNVIKTIAFRLPAHVRLLVKEHPSAVALQPLGFYRDLDKLPNVELIAPGVNAKQLARDSLGVICVTSTLGFEAAALNKPVICLGDVLYGYFPNVRMIGHFGDLNAALDWAMDYRPIDPSDIADAMAAYVEFTDPGKFSFRESLGQADELDNIAAILAGRLAAPGTLMSSNHPIVEHG
ncbi:hypothetical protein CA223_00625 [Sphingomonas koreensis]|jgi:hypothetical protein|uniref:Capsular biosynthesis protein n=1 Tax=Sphingomonas koreensis TaxID=93064 RepID=A0A1L6JFF8_9SPHN|nr:hypothetical protein [Sphingomonas koreensis]APR54547.1 hypothetical protein BRX40_20865 [Sphingomonas koreensis]MDC7810892.1 hypothetical protein [Sphingomonas koreensis]RSU20485.1 hypothetical protein CA224_10445 [Sphingomonas koreensis]RSU28819.1 hypothetical protein CA225_09000 [Sphingomonas koreensis]RSU29667.1 hypothetical protein CA222_03425 [Sphingomonas koreensis]